MPGTWPRPWSRWAEKKGNDNCRRSSANIKSARYTGLILDNDQFGGMAEPIDISNSFSDISETGSIRLLDMFALQYRNGRLLLGSVREGQIVYRGHFQIGTLSHERRFSLLQENAPDCEFRVSYGSMLEAEGNDTPFKRNIGINESIAKQLMPIKMLGDIDRTLLDII